MGLILVQVEVKYLVLVSLANSPPRPYSCFTPYPAFYPLDFHKEKSKLFQGSKASMVKLQHCSPVLTFLSKIPPVSGEGSSTSLSIRKLSGKVKVNSPIKGNFQIQEEA